MKIICYLLKLNIKKEYGPNLHPPYNERQQKIIEMIDWALAKYKAAPNMKKINEQVIEQVIIDNIIEELDKKEK